jgi:hypothetical protein
VVPHAATTSARARAESVERRDVRLGMGAHWTLARETVEGKRKPTKMDR